MGLAQQLVQLYLKTLGGQAPTGAPASTGDISQMLKYVVANLGGASKSQVPIVDFPFHPGAMTGNADITISGNTTWNAQSDRLKLADQFIIQSGFTLTQRGGLLVVCRQLTLESSAVLDCGGGAGGTLNINASGATPGSGGAGGASDISQGGTGGNGGSQANGTGGTQPAALTQDSGTPDLTPLSQTLERTMLAVMLAAVPGHGVFGLGGRGGGGGGGGGGESRTGGTGAAGGDATGYANATGGAGNTGGTGSNAGGAGSQAPAPTLPTNDFIRLFGQIIFWLWYYGAGTGGGGGGGGAGDASTAALAGGGGGGGGGGGAPLLVICDELNNAGTIKTNGGNGSNGGNASSFGTEDAGGGGGGGGGGAANCIIVARSITASGTIQANGGSAGNAGNGSTGGGGNGGAGAAGRNGIALLVRAA